MLLPALFAPVKQIQTAKRTQRGIPSVPSVLYSRLHTVQATIKKAERGAATQGRWDAAQVATFLLWGIIPEAPRTGGGAACPPRAAPRHPGVMKRAKTFRFLSLQTIYPFLVGGKKKKEPTPQASCAPSPRASVSASVKWGGAALPGRGRGAAALPEPRGSYGFPFTPRVGGGSRAWRGVSSFPGAGAAAAQRRCSQKRRSRGASAELGTLRPAADPAPSAHFYICAPFQSSVTCPALRPIGGALWSGQWKGLGQSTRRLPWR